MADTDITQLQVNMGVMMSQMAEVKKQTNRIEQKIDNQSYATVSFVEKLEEKVDNNKEEASKVYVTKSEYKAVMAIVIALLVAIFSASCGIFINSIRLVK